MRARTGTSKAAILLAAILLSLSACSEDPRVAPLAAGWQYRWGDPPRVGDRLAWSSEDFSAPGWSPLDLPAQPPERVGATFLWMQVRLPATTDATTQLFLKYVDQNVAAFVDGRAVYQFGDLDSAAIRLGRPFHLVPVGAGAEGRTLALRVRSEHATIGPFGVPWLGPEAALQRHILRDGLGAFGAGLVLLVFGATVLAAWLFFLRRDRRVLALGLFALAGGIYSVTTVYSPVKQLLLDAPAALWYVELGSVYFAPAAYFGFYAAIAQGPRQRSIARWIYVLLGCFTLGSVVGGLAGLFSITSTLQPFHYSLTVAIVLGLAMAVPGAWGGSVEAWVYLAGMLVVTAAGVHDTFLDERLYPGESAWIVWGFAFFVFCLGVYLVFVYARQYQERDKLTERVAAQNAELTRARERFAQIAGDLTREVETILEASSKQAATASQQAAANHQTGATVFEIAQISKEAARAAGTVVETADRSTELYQRGEKAVAEAVAAMEELSRQVSGIAAKVSAFGERAQQISGITETTQELAEQSNLLALNAAIEAARAGELGKGFAVVAQEMRTLAEQSKAGATKVRSLLSEVQGETHAAVEATERGTASAGRVLELAREAGTAIQTLAGVIQDSSRVAKQIAQSSQEQTRGVEQIVAAIQDSSGALDEALKGNQRIEEVARTLTTLAKQLAQMSGAEAAP